MDMDDLFPAKPGDPLTELTRQDLGPMSIDELEARIATLRDEIDRIERHLASAATHRAAADALFKR
jgi:uncharacterized small protein (DUF1192 family)